MSATTSPLFETVGFVARHSGVSEGLVRRYDRLGLIESQRDPYGRRMFPLGTAEKVRLLKAERVANRLARSVAD